MPSLDMYTQIRLSCLETFFQDQGIQYLALQQAGFFTDIVLYCKDGCVSLHQAVLLPHSRVLAYYSSMVSMTDKPMALILPDYDVSTAQSLVSLLYTGSCSLKSSTSYFSLLSMLSSLAINLSSRSLALQSTSQNNIMDGSKSNDISSSTLIKPFTSQNLSSKENEDIATSEGVNNIETMVNMEVASNHNIEVSEAETNHINQQLDTTCSAKISEQEEQPTAINLTANLCPVCKVQVGGGNFLLRKHLVEKHFFKELSSMLGEGITQCPVCEKTVVPRFSLVRHFGIVHRRVDQLVGVDINQNNSTNIAINEVPNNGVEGKDVQDDLTDESRITGMQRSHKGKFECNQCGCIRKSQFRLLQHYSVAHYKDELEDLFGDQFVSNNGTCPVCSKIMKNLDFFLIHMGAAHGEVSNFLENEVKSDGLNRETTPNYWLCPREDCTCKFPHKSLLMRHLTFTHYNVDLSTALRPFFLDSKSCRDCGKVFPDFQRYLLHYAVTHRLLLTYCSQSERDVLQGQEANKDIGRKTRNFDGDKLFRCKLCNFEVYNNNYLLKKHYTAKHFIDKLSSKFPNSVSSGVCEICGKQYSAGNRLIHHLGVTHDEVDHFIEDADNDGLMDATAKKNIL